MTEATLDIDITVDPNLTDMVSGDLPTNRAPELGSPVWADDLAEELRRIKAEARLHTQLLQAILARLEPITQFVVSDSLL